LFDFVCIAYCFLSTMFAWWIKTLITDAQIYGNRSSPIFVTGLYASHKFLPNIRQWEWGSAYTRVYMVLTNIHIHCEFWHGVTWAPACGYLYSAKVIGRLVGRRADEIKCQTVEYQLECVTQQAMLLMQNNTCSYYEQLQHFIYANTCHPESR